MWGLRLTSRTTIQVHAQLWHFGTSQRINAQIPTAIIAARTENRTRRTRIGETRWVWLTTVNAQQVATLRRPLQPLSTLKAIVLPAEAPLNVVR